MHTQPSAEAREVARAAARWLALLESGSASEGDQRKLLAWRNRCRSHEQAWQKAQALRQRFSGLPAQLALATLDRPEPGRRAMLKGALGLAVVLPAGWLLARQPSLQAWRADLHTGTGEQRRLTLADGSTLQLDTASAVNLDLGARQLNLVRGEIALKVNGATPLAIQAPYGRILVSHSDVCVRLNTQNCEVSVFSGAVQVQPLRGPLIALAQGQRLTLNASGAGAASGFDAQLPGWREGVLMAQDQPLGDFLRELDRYRPGVLRWAPSLEALRVTGSFRLDNTDRILSLLAASLPLQVQSRTRYWVTLVPRPATAPSNLG